MTPRVSVVIPCFNGGATLAQTLNSVRGQTFAEWEVIVVDDGSTDSSGDIISEYRRRDDRIGGVAHANRGLGAARNTGLAKAQGEFVVFLDADDLLCPPMIERMVGRLVSDPAIGLAHCGWIYTDPDGRDLSWMNTTPVEGALFDRLAHGNLFPCHSLMLRRSLLEATGDFDESIRHCHDWDLWIRMARTGTRFGAVPGALVVYRMLRLSLSRSPRTFFEAGAQILRRAHGPDPRVKRPAEGLQDGCRCAHERDALLDWLVYCLGLAVAQGNNVAASELVETALDGDRHELTPAHLRRIVLPLHFGAAIPWRDHQRLMTEVGAALLQFLVGEEIASKRPGFALECLREILGAHPSWRSAMLADISGRKMLRVLPQRLLRRLWRAR